MTAMAANMSARQRKHIYMHSTIFEPDGPAPRSVYAPNRQHELYDNFSETLGTANRGRQPELEMPSALDMKCTHNAGHNAVLPGGSQDVIKANTSRMSREVVVHDGEAAPVVKAAGKDHETIPREFWSTDTNLQWHDTRNEKCRSANQVDRQGMAAHELKRQDLSSEVFGKPRITEPSNTKLTARQQLMSDSADYLRMDSSLHAPKQSSGQSAPNGQEARARLHQNLASSVHNTMPIAQGHQHGPIPVPAQGDDPSNLPRRRQEKNFSDILGAQMGERKEVRGNREEVTGTQMCSFLDPRCEIASRNKDHWRPDEHQSPSRRKDAERESNLFDFDCPEKPAMEPGREQVLRQERSCWDSKACMEATSETARRRRMKDHLNDFQDSSGRTHTSRKQESLSSSQMRSGMGAPPEPYEAWAETMASPPRSLAAGSYSGRQPPPLEREALLRSAKDTKLASLQSSIFS